MNIAVLGFGTVGYGVYELAAKTDNITVKYVLDLKKHEGITAKSVTDIGEILSDGSVDTVVELIGGHNPAHGFIVSALKSGKNVITANKLVICEHYEELTALAKENNVALRYTAAVGGGIPWLINLERTIKTSKVHKVRGIFNGTTNYILDAMHCNSTQFDVALKEAQKLGFAEADPSSDIDGLDTKRKIAISANIAFGVSVNPDEVDVIGIRNVSAQALRDAEAHGYVCRLIAKAKDSDGEISAWVEPTFVKTTSPYACVSQNYNRISLDAENIGNLSFFGYGAGRYPTAFTVINDCVDVANGVKKTYNENMKKVHINNSLASHCYYISSSACDKIEIPTREKWASGILTEPVSIREMHDLYKELLNKDPQAFIAGVY